MKDLKEISFKERNEIFRRLEEIASRANLSKEEYAQYRYEWKINNDFYNCLDSAIEQGIEQGEQKANLKNAKRMKDMNFPVETITQITGLSEDVINSI